MTHRDFLAACEREGIIVLRGVLTNLKGILFRQGGVPFIIINKKLRGAERIGVEFHELGHYLLAHDGRALLKMPKQAAKAQSSWNEVEADACAAIALKPTAELHKPMRRLLTRLMKPTRKGGK